MYDYNNDLYILFKGAGHSHKPAHGKTREKAWTQHKEGPTTLARIKNLEKLIPSRF